MKSHPAPARHAAARHSPGESQLAAVEGAFRRGDFAATERLAAALVRSHPHHPFGWKALAAAMHGLGKVAESLAPAAKAAQLRPADANAHNNLGNILRDLGRMEASEASCRRALALRPDFAEAHTNLGNVLRDTGRLEQAEASYRRALAIAPRDAFAHSNLGSVLRDTGRIALAEEHLRHALALKPDFADAHNNLALVLQLRGLKHDAEACYRRAIELDPEHLAGYSSLLFSLNYSACGASDEPRALAGRFGAVASARAGTPYRTWETDEAPARLRVGLVSGDLRSHPVGHFLEAVLRSVDPRRLELLAYSAAPPTSDDALTARIRPRFDRWTPLHDQTDAQVAERIRRDGVHVLLDLSGHTKGNRLPVFARRPAPVQATWLGYFATTGMAQMDYVIGDPHVTPAHEEHHFGERVWRLPESYLCFTPPDVALDVSELPARDAGHVTFGSFNNLAKLGVDVVAVWAAILHRVPRSRLFLKCKQLGDDAVRRQTLALFAEGGIAPERLVLEGPSPREALLAAYRRVDIALDPFPYPGGTTSVEALWMGVPVLTRRGDRFLSHVGESIACNAGLADWIAADDVEYVAKATAFSGNLEALASLRCGLRARTLASPLFDATRFARHLEHALWSMWQRRRDNHPQEPATSPLP